MIFRNGLYCDYHFIIAEGFQGEFNCLKENIEKYKIFSVPITKIVKIIIDKNGEYITETKSCKSYNLLPYLTIYY